jgi:hypothetical protein
MESAADSEKPPQRLDIYFAEYALVCIIDVMLGDHLSI